MTNYNHQFKKNLIAECIGRDLSIALRGGGKTNLSPKAFIATSVLVTSLAVSPISHAEIENNGKPIFVNGIYEDSGYVGVDEKFSDSNASFDIDIVQIGENNYFGLSVSHGSTLTMDPINSLNINYSDTKSLDKTVNGIENQYSAITDIKANDDITVSITANTSARIQGIVNNTATLSNNQYSSQLALSSENGSINVNVANDKNLAASNIHGLINNNGGVTELRAKENITITASVAVAQENADLTAITNDPGNFNSNSRVSLNAGGYIHLKANGNGSLIGIDNGQDAVISLNSHGKDDSGYGIKIATNATGLNSYAVQNMLGNVNLTTETGSVLIASMGGTSSNRAINSTGGTVKIKSAENVSIISSADTSSSDSSAIFVTSNQTEDFSIEGQTLELTSYSGKTYSYGIQVQNGFVNLIGNTLKIDTSAATTSKAYSLYSVSGNINATINGLASIHSSGTGLYSWKYFAAEPAISVTSSGSNVQAGSTGLRSNGENATVKLTATGDNTVNENNVDFTGKNVISAHVGLSSENSGKIELTAFKGNDIYSDFRDGYGSGLAIRTLTGGVVEISAQETNSIFGAISSKNEGSSVFVDGKTNTVRSYAVISNAGNLNNATDDKFKDNRVISALYAEGTGAQISLTGDQNYLSTFADSDVHTDLERVVWAYDSANINIDGFTSITTDSYERSLNSIDIAIAAGTAVNLTEGIVNKPVADHAKVQINYGNTTDSEGKAVLSNVTGDILSAYAGSVNISPKSSSDGLVVTGNLFAGNNGELTVDIGTNGVITGRADDYGDAGFIKDSEHTTFFDPAFSSAIYKGGQVNLKMGDNARWNVTGQSWITDISIADGAKNVLIDLVNANTDRNSTAHALTVYNLNGNATFNMSLNGNRDVSDMLYIRNANGNYNVNVVDAVTVDDMYKGGLNGLRLATVGAGSKAKFRAFTYDQGALNVEYEVATDSYDNNPENNIYNGTEMSHEKPGSNVVDGLFGHEEGTVVTLAANEESATNEADGTISETTNFKLVDRKDATPSDSGKTIIDHARANYANAVQLDTLNKRQGEMRFKQGHEDGLWIRIRHDDIGKRSSFRLDNTMVEVGADSRYVKETGEFHTGVAFDYMNGDTDYHNISGEGNLDRYGMWFYTTWLGNEGDYTDFIIKCSLINNEYKIYAPTTGEKITGDYDNNVISVSLEHGKKYSNEESWFIEPQLQLQYAYVTSSEYTNSQGTDIRLDGIQSLIGRVGVRAGKDVTLDNPFTFYARGDIMHEFMGKQDITAKDTTGTMRVRYENDDTWYSAGLGVSYLHNKDKYYFFEAEKVFGGSNTSSYIISGGMRFLFD